MSKFTWALVAVVTFASACASGSAPTSAPSTPAPAPEAKSAGGGELIATYADKRFTSEDFKREVEHLPPRSRAQLTTPEKKKQFVDNFILNDLLATQGRAKGYDHDPDIVRQVDDLRERLIVQRVMRDYQEAPTISDDEVKAYYDQNQRLFSGAQIRASHILVKDEALAKKLHDEVVADPSKFEDLAKTNSVDTATAARGGDLGYFGQGRMVAEFERAAFALEKPGDISPVVQTPFGFHIIKLTERKEGPNKPFDEVKDRIRVAMTNQRRQDLVTQRMDKIKADAKIEVHEDALDKVELAPAPSLSDLPPVGGH